ncbi:MAG: glutamyl-tRNA reductase [Planctomycetota bacterium]
MRIISLGISHHTADVALRENAAFSGDNLVEVLSAFREDYPHVEAALLSTCNRTQWIIARPSHAAPDAKTLIDWWARRRGVTNQALEPAVASHLQGDAVLHLFRVTAGLDAMIVGEPEIHHQVKRAYDAAVAARTAGPVLHHVFQHALAAAGNARHETGLSRAGASVPSATVASIRANTDSLTEKHVVCIGAGDLAKATLRGLLRSGVERITVANRTLDHAAALADELALPTSQRRIIRLDEVPAALHDADVLIAAADTEHTLIDAGTVAFARNGTHRPLMIFDLAMPRSVAKDVENIEHVQLFDLEALSETVRDDPARAAAIARCEERLAADAAACLTRVRNREIGQLIRQLRTRLHDIADEERQRSHRKLVGSFGDDAQAEQLEHLIEEHGRRLINKVLHLPLQQLDARRDDVALGFYAAALRRLFDLQDMPTAEQEHQRDSGKPTP